MGTDHPPAHRVLPPVGAHGAPSGPPVDTVSLDYEARMIRRKRLITDRGAAFLVDLAQTTSLEDGAGLELTDGRWIEVRAAPEDVVRVSGPMARLAWHIGNRHTPCQIAPDHLIIRRDHVLEAMLHQLGAVLEIAHAPFCPEGGAYGHGRTMGHDHGPDHSHSHSHVHSHNHDHTDDHALPHDHA